MFYSWLNSLLLGDEDPKLMALSPQPPNWVTKLISLQADLIYNCLVPVFTPSPVVSESSYHQAQETIPNAESAVYQIPSTITPLLKRFGLGFLSAAYVCMVLLLVLLLAAVLGVGFVHLWAEEPVFVREKLHFDYTHAHPVAVFSFDGFSNKKRIGVPIGHTFYISLLLVMPESNFNRDIGVFQVCLHTALHFSQIYHAAELILRKANEYSLLQTSTATTTQHPTTRIRAPIELELRWVACL